MIDNEPVVQIRYTRGLRSDGDPIVARRGSKSPPSRPWSQDTSSVLYPTGLPVQPMMGTSWMANGVPNDDDEIEGRNSARRGGVDALASSGCPPGLAPLVEEHQPLQSYQYPSGNVATNAPATLVHKSVIFTVTERISDGSVGRVVGASNGGKPYAVKMVHKWRAFKAYLCAREMFVKEREAMVRVSEKSATPYLVKLLMSWEDPEKYYFVMPRYASNMQIRLQEGPMSEHDKLLYCVELISALQTLQGLNIVHHDIKPGNILIDTDGRAVLSDFGLAALVEPDSRATWRAFNQSGTPAYMPPEVLAWDHATRGHGAEVDVWSLGIVMLEILGLTDRWCFVVPSCEMARKLHKQFLPIRFDDLSEGPRGVLAPLLSQMLEIDPERRIAAPDLHSHIPSDLWQQVSDSTQIHDWRPSAGSADSRQSSQHCLDFATFLESEKRFARFESATNLKASLRRSFDEEKTEANENAFEYIAPGEFETSLSSRL
ncbi:kinase-like domain-containing protein [Trametes polyzona]|nr:kinase-like domain-containing protein [Trametes polyzona]